MASDATSFEYLVHGQPRTALLVVLLILTPMAAMAFVASRALGVLIELGALVFLWHEWQARARVLSYFRMDEVSLSFRLQSAPEVRLALTEIACVYIYGPPERDYITFALRDGREVQLWQNRLRGSIVPIAEHLYESFPGNVVDVDQPRRPSGTLAERLAGTEHGHRIIDSDGGVNRDDP